MNKETEAKIYELIEYATKTLKYYSENDDKFCKLSLSLTRHSARELIPLAEKELINYKVTGGEE